MVCRITGALYSHNVNLRSTVHFRMLFRVCLLRWFMAFSQCCQLMYSWTLFSCLQCTTLWLPGTLFSSRFKPRFLMLSNVCNGWPTPNRHRRDIHFEVGEKVWLATKHLPLRLGTRKLAAIWTGPYTILERVGPVAFRL